MRFVEWLIAPFLWLVNGYLWLDGTFGSKNVRKGACLLFALFLWWLSVHDWDAFIKASEYVPNRRGLSYTLMRIGTSEIMTKPLLNL